MLEKIGNFFVQVIRKLLPDSFVFAILLTVLTIILAMTLAGVSFNEVITIWIEGVFKQEIIFFAFLMIMLLTFGYCIGISKPFKKVFNILAGYIDKPWKVYLSILFTALTMMLFNWGLIPIAAIFAVEVCKRVRNVDYRLACASLYCGILVWHGGLSASAPLMMATEETAKIFLDKGIISSVIPISATLFIPLNITLVIACYSLLPLCIFLLIPKTVDPRFDAALHYQEGFDLRQEEEILAQEEMKSVSSRFFDYLCFWKRPAKDSIADWFNSTPLVSLVLVIASFLGFISIMKNSGFNLTALVILMFSVGVLLHWRPINYVNAMKEAIKGTSDIVLQYPLFGGIMNLFINTGLAVIFAEALLRFADAQTLPLAAFIVSGIVNLFIPSGGGEWLVLGTPLLTAANLTGADIGRTIIGFAYGDALTNLINPFWTLVFLPIMRHLMKVEARDFMGYTVLVCIIFFVIEAIIIFFV